MLDMHNLTDKQMSKYNLKREEPSFSGFEDGEYFIMIDNTDFWIIGIDEEKDIVYAEYDGDGIFHSISFGAIEDLQNNEYAIIGVQKKFIQGMSSTRNIEDPIGDVKEFLKENRVYKLKYQGGE